MILHRFPSCEHDQFCSSEHTAKARGLLGINSQLHHLWPGQHSSESPEETKTQTEPQQTISSKNPEATKWPYFATAHKTLDVKPLKKEPLWTFQLDTPEKSLNTGKLLGRD